MSVACVGCGDTSGEFDLDYSAGQYVCLKCGVVQPEQVIDSGKEWRNFENDDKGTDRARAEKVDDDFHTLGTHISTSNFGSSSVSLQAKALSKYSKLAAIGENKNENQMKEAFQRLNELCESLQLPSLINQTAKDILRQFEKQRDKNMKGYKKDAFLVAVLLLSCKQAQGGRTLKSLARATDIEEKEIKRFYKMLLRDSSITSMGDNDRKSTVHQTQELVEVFCNRLQQPFQVIKDAKEVSAKAISFLEGKRPSSIAAASILFVLNVMRLQHKQQELATVAGISANTLRNVYKEINKNLDQLPSHLFQLKAVSN